MTRPKYALAEIERRWLVDAAHRDLWLDVSPTRIVDIYIKGTRLRLRHAIGPGGETFKLGKKYGDQRGFSESITNLYLSADEFAITSALPGARVVKDRYAVAEGAVDVYAEPAGVCIYSVEFADDASAGAHQPPAFAGREVTSDARYSGHALAHRHGPALDE